MVDHIAVFTDRRCPGGVSLQPQTEVWPRRSADLREGLEAADAAVEELGRLRVQVAAQFAETVEGQQLVGFGFHAVGLQYGDRLLDQRRIETGVHVVHAEAQAIAQHDGGTDVGGDHALFNDAVSAAALFGNDLQHVAFFTQHEAVVRAIFKHQRMLVAPGVARVANAFQQGYLLCDGVARRLPAGNAFQPVGHFVVYQLGFGFDLGGEELNIFAQRAVGGDGHAASQHLAALVRAQRAQVVRQIARQHRDVEARQVVGEGAHAGDIVQLAALLDVGGRIGDGDGQLQRTVAVVGHVQRIVHVFGAGAVDGDEFERGQIFTRRRGGRFAESQHLRRLFFQVVTRQRHPPRGEMVFTVGDKLGQIGVEAAIAFQRMTAHFRHRPVAGLEVVGQLTHRAARNRLFQQRMIGHDGQTVVALLHAADKARQERLDQGFRLGDFALFLGVQGGDNAIPVHDFLHVRRRNEVTFLTVYFKKAKAFLSPFHDAFNARGLRVKLLFKLRQQRVILKHIVQ
ncbi:Uncharacterised protein [Serratia marcescens]|nr:Uncharacterised protein [Serratia marcescens]CVE33257.1 Uncharacterised protein [Serratia marcescens]